MKTLEAVIGQQGHVKLLESIRLAGPRRALVTIPEKSPEESSAEDARLSEAALAADWNRPEEDESWAHLQQLP